jgi:hypothetical protein
MILSFAGQHSRDFAVSLHLVRSGPEKTADSGVIIMLALEVL